MKTPKRIAVKRYFQAPHNPDPMTILRVFHRWIREKTVEGLLIDAADYKHLPKGPGIVLVGLDVDYAVDNSDGIPGLLVRQKRYDPETTPFDELVLRSLQLIAEASRQLEIEPLLDGLRFSDQGFVLSLPDRLLYPNTEESFWTAAQALQAALFPLVGDQVQVIRLSSDPRKTLRIELGFQGTQTFQTLQARLQESLLPA